MLRRITGPINEPISLEEARDHLRVDINDDDELIERLITAARLQAENYLRRSLTTSTWELRSPCFPRELRLRMAPVQTVVSIKYLDTQGVEQTLDTSEYYPVLTAEPAVVVPKPDKSWPQTQALPDAVRVRYTAGYGDDGTDVPEPIRQWILLQIGSMYENRESIVGTSVNDLPRSSCDSLLDHYRLIEA